MAAGRKEKKRPPRAAREELCSHSERMETGDMGETGPLAQAENRKRKSKIMGGRDHQNPSLGYSVIITGYSSVRHATQNTYSKLGGQRE